MNLRSLVVAVAAAASIATVSAFLVVLLYDSRSAPAILIEDAPSDVQIAVSVSGAVATPGVYRLSGDARLIDAINAAGGFGPAADVSALNLAARLEDEQQIVVPSRHSAATPVAGSPPPTAVGEPARINVNTAGVTELDRLPGIGPTIAQRIIDYRAANGPFARVEDLARVDGISPAMVEELRDQITVDP